jgi:hypothetical protein
LLATPVGRNDDFTCGLKQKLKHCCLKLEPGRRVPQHSLQHLHSLEDRKLTLLVAAIDIFDLKRG